MRPSNAKTTAAVILWCLTLAGCGESTTSTPQVPQDPTRPQQPPAVDRDFGIIAHGESETRDYELDVASLSGGPYVPLRAQLDCSCGHATLVLRAADGTERTVDGRPNADNAARPGETLIVRVVVNTLTKDPVDLPKTTSRGYVVLQPTDDGTGLRRVTWPILVRFGIDCPVVVSPFAAIDFGAVAQSARPEMVLSLRGDADHPDVKFRQVASSHSAIEVALEQDEGVTRLRVRCLPGEHGNGRAVVAVSTDLASGYRVNLGVTWKVVNDLVASPMNKLAFRTKLGGAQTEAESSSQYLLVTNHDVSKSEEFTVHEIVGADGNDASSSFGVRFEAAPGRPRQKRMFVRYLGGLDATFRGRLVLTVDGEAGPFLPIQLVVFPIK